MKRVLLVTRAITPPWDEASKNFAYTLAKKYKEYRATLLTKGRIDDPHNRFDQLPIYYSSMLDRHRFLTAAQKLRLLKLRRHFNDYQLVHFLLTPSLLSSRLFKLIVPKKVKTVQSVAAVRTDRYTPKQLRETLWADAIVTYSHYASKKLRDINVDNTMIYPGIDTQLFKPQPKDKKLLAKYKLSNKDFVVMYPGEYVRLGATDLIANSVQGLKDTIPNVKVMFACRIKSNDDVLRRDAMLEDLKQRKLDSYVVTTGTEPDMVALYNTADVIIFPVGNLTGKFDLPLSILEAMACSKPLVLTDIPKLAELNKLPFVETIPPNDEQALIKTLVALHKNDENRRTVGAADRDYIVKNFDINVITTQYEDLYNSLLER